jgi:hypothetical protein
MPQLLMQSLEACLKRLKKALGASGAPRELLLQVDQVLDELGHLVTPTKAKGPKRAAKKGRAKKAAARKKR